MNHLQKIFLALFIVITCKVYSKSEVVELRSTTSLFIQVTDTTLIEKHQIANKFYEEGKYSEALRRSLSLLQEAKTDDNIQVITDTYYLLGKIWYKSKSYEKAITYFKASLDGYVTYYEDNKVFEADDPDSQIEFLLLENNFKIGNSYHRLFERSDLDSIRELVYKDSTIYYYEEVIKKQHLKENFLLIQGKAYNNLSGIVVRDSLFELAESYGKKSLQIKKKIGDQYGIASAYQNLSNIHFFRNEFGKSRETLEKALEVLENITGEKADLIKADLYFNLAYSMYKLKDYEAYKFQELSYNLTDDLNEKNNKRVLEEINAKNNFEVGKLFGIQQEEFKKQKAQTVSWIIGISSFFVIVLLVFFLNQYKLRQKNLGLELSRQELMQQQKLEKIKAESQIRILNATLDGKESERKQIAETLHDSVSALLSSANLHLQACKTQFNGSTPIEVDKSQSIINEASQKIRDLSHTLVSSILLKFGLSFAIKDIAEKFSNSELKIYYDTRYIKRYDQGFEIKLYNIIQEFINNILKHSHASHAQITLVEKKKKLHLIIEDNGQGFDKAQIPEKDGLGINQIDARIQMMKGKFTIETAHGKGTKIVIELPVFEKEPITIS